MALIPVGKAIEFSIIAAQIVGRLSEYYGNDQAPEAIRHILIQLPLIAKKVDELKRKDKSDEVVLIVNQFQVLITQLDVLTQSINPSKSDSTFTKGKKIFRSFRNENELAKIWPNIETYKSTLAFYYLNIGSNGEFKTISSFPSNIGHLITRHSILDDLEKVSNSDYKQIALTGMTGCGKTQVAIEFCQDCEKSGKYSAIFWVDSSSSTSINQSFLSFSVIIDPKADPKNDSAAVNIVKYALDHLDRPWLVVFDNFDPELVHVEDYLPKSNNGVVLFTSRNVNINGKKDIYSIELDRMDDEEGVELLLHEARCAKSDSNVIAAKKITARLGGLAVAIAQLGQYAGSYGLTLDQLLDQYSTNQDVLKKVVGVGDTAFKGFHEIGDLKELLIRAAFLNNDNVFEDLFKSYFELKKSEWLSVFARDGTWDSKKYQEAIITLEKSRLILNFENDYIGGTTFNIHPLLQDWVKLGLTNEQITTTVEEVVSILANYVDNHDISSLTHRTKQLILSHAEISLRNEESILNRRNDQSVIRSRVIPLLEIPKQREAVKTSEPVTFCDQDNEEELKQELIRLEKTLGPDHNDTIETVIKLGKLYQSQGDFIKARRMIQRVYESRSNLLGPNHSDTLSSLEILALISSEQGKLEEAITIREVVLSGREKTLGLNDWHTLETIDRLADDYVVVYNFTKAKSLLKKALKVREELLGEDNKDTLGNINHLAKVYKGDGSYHTCKSLFQRALKGRESLLGNNHLDTLDTVYELAELYEYHMEFEKAEEMYERCYNSRKRILGVIDKDTLKTGHNLANVYKHEKKYEEARKLYTTVVNGREKLLGGEHEDTLDSKKNLAVVYYYLNEIDEAQVRLNEVLDIMKRVYGIDNKKTVAVTKELNYIKGKEGSQKSTV